MSAWFTFKHLWTEESHCLVLACWLRLVCGGGGDLQFAHQLAGEVAQAARARNLPPPLLRLHAFDTVHPRNILKHQSIF